MQSIMLGAIFWPGTVQPGPKPVHAARLRRLRAAGLGLRLGLGLGLSLGLGLALLGLTSAGAALAASRSQDELFTVSDIWVNKTDSDPGQARDTAIADGEIRAFPMLLRRLTLASDHARLPMPDEAEILAMVTGFEVDDEYVAPMRYAGRLTVSFNPVAVRNLLEANGLTLAEASPRPILVLPVMEGTGSGAVNASNASNASNSSNSSNAGWFDDNNPWRQAWRTARQKGVLQKWVVARPDMVTTPPKDQEELIRKSDSIFRNTLARGNYQGLALVLIEPSSDGQIYGLSLVINGEKVKLDPMTLQEGESYEGSIHRAMSLLSNALDEAWKRDSLLAARDLAEMAMLSQVTNLDDWLKLQQILGDMPQIRSHDIQEISNGRSVILVDFVGGLAALRGALNQRGLGVNETKDGLELVILDGKNSPKTNASQAPQTNSPQTPGATP